MKRELFILVGAMVALCAANAANVWHVDVANEGKSGLDGSTRALAFGDIQSAIDAETTQAGDTILIWPGDYQTGLYTNLINGVYSVRARVYVTKANLTIKAAEKGSVRIIGAHDPDYEASNYGVGPKAIACVRCSVGANNDKPFATYLEGIQLLNGATTCFEYSYYDSSAGKTKTPDAMGGGFCNAGISDSSRNFLVDCVISNCVAGTGGGTVYATCHRCTFVDNYSTYGSAIRGGKAANSLFVNNRGVTLAYSSAVNCTIYGTAETTISSGNADENFFDNDVLLEGSIKSGLYTRGSVTNTTAQNVMVAPCLGDYRVLANSPAVGSGDASRLSYVTEPSGVDFVRKDLAGNALPASGALQAGCFQEVVTPAGGLATFTVNDALTMEGALEVDGHCVASGESVWATAWPTQWCVRAAATATKPLHSIKAREFDVRRFPGSDETIWITAPAPGMTNRYVFSYAQEVRYVDKATGSDDYDGTAAEPAADAATSKVGPWRTIQKSVDDAAERAWRRVYVAPGTYDEGGDLNSESSGGDLCSRVLIPQNKYVFITSTDGATTTFIKGAPDPQAGAEDEGLGTNAVRCVFCYCAEAAVRGFTLTNGHTRLLGRVKNDKVRQYGLKGAAWYGDGWGTLLDSTIIGNHGHSNILYSRCRFERCKVVGNTMHEAKGSVLSGPITATACVFAGNDGVLMESSVTTNVNATCVGGAANAWLTANGNDAKIYHSIVADYGTVSNGVIRGCLFDNTTVSKKGAVYATGEAHFVDKAGRDFRVEKESDAVGVALSADELQAIVPLVATTFDGQPALLGGRANVAGAHRDPVQSNKMYVNAASGGLKVNGAAPAAVSVIAGDATAVITIDKTNAAPVTGVTVNGVFHALGDDGCLTVTAADMDAKGYLVVEAAYGTTWYADAENGDDANSGFTAAWPKKTLAGAMACARSGDVVLAAEGDYDEGTMEQPVYAGALVRVMVKNGVTLRAAGAAARTRIVGAAATKDTGTGDYQARGFGTNAVRCVRLQSNARIEGFTLTGGRTWRLHGDSYDGGNGAAISAVDDDLCIAKDCIITDCDACGYVLNRVTLVNCRVTGNRASWNFSRGCSFIGTLLAANRSNSTPMLYSPRFENSTFAADNVQNDGTTSWKDGTAFDAGGDAQNLKCIVNSIVCGNVSKWLCVTNSVFLAGNLPASLYEKVNVLEVSEDELQLDEQYRPKIGFCAATNAADFARVDTNLCGTVDLAGRPRVQNGGMDAGCLEADWLGAYSAALGPRATVEAASAGTKLLADGGVQVEEATLAIAVEKDMRYQVKFEIAGGGTLAFYDGETLVDSFTASGSFEALASAAGTARYRVVYVGEGRATLRAVRAQTGLLLLVR